MYDYRCLAVQVETWRTKAAGVQVHSVAAVGEVYARDPRVR
ncbi:MAG: hypothetical protein NVSMB27_49940 [Ktedonobacteraceae bacterium]